MNKWQVKISGHKFDIDEIKESFKDSYFKILKNDNEYYIDSDTFDTCKNTTEVKKEALKLITLINGLGLVFINSFQPIKIIQEYIKKADGKNHKIIVLEPEPIVIRSKASGNFKLTKNGNKEEIKHRNVYSDLFRHAYNEPLVQDALKYLKYGDWINLYKAFEIVRDYCGGEHKLFEQNWAPKIDLRTFKQVAQSKEALGDQARHASKKYKPPNRKMSISEAKSLINQMLKNWILSISSKTS